MPLRVQFEIAGVREVFGRAAGEDLVADIFGAVVRHAGSEQVLRVDCPAQHAPGGAAVAPGDAVISRRR